MFINKSKVDALRNSLIEKGFELSDDSTIEEMINAISTTGDEPAPDPAPVVAAPDPAPTVAVPAPAPTTGLSAEDIQAMIDTSLTDNNSQVQTMIESVVSESMVSVNESVSQLTTLITALGKSKLTVVQSTANNADPAAPIITGVQDPDPQAQDENTPLAGEIFTQVIMGGTHNVETFKNTIKKAQ